MNDTIDAVKPISRDAVEQAWKHWDNLVKPPRSLGLLETIIASMAGAYGAMPPRALKKALVIMCADHGVTAEGVAQNGAEVTAMMTEVIGQRLSVACRMAHAAGAEVVAVNIGVKQSIHGDNIVDRCIRRGTANIAREPAMSLTETIQAIEVGIETANTLMDGGVNLLATGEMGIGNTTPSAAVAASLLGLPASETTGRGAGASDLAYRHKIDIVEQSIKVNKPDPNDPLDVLRKVGGLDIAGMAGVFLAGAARRVPVIVDGFISSASALIAKRLCPDAAGYMLASHLSREKAAGLLLDALGLEASVHAHMRLGEGTGAVALTPLIDLALAAFYETATFDGTGIGEYVPR